MAEEIKKIEKKEENNKVKAGKVKIDAGEVVTKKDQKNEAVKAENAVEVPVAAPKKRKKGLGEIKIKKKKPSSFWKKLTLGLTVAIAAFLYAGHTYRTSATEQELTGKIINPQAKIEEKDETDLAKRDFAVINTTETGNIEAIGCYFVDNPAEDRGKVFGIGFGKTN